MLSDTNTRKMHRRDFLTATAGTAVTAAVADKAHAAAIRPNVEWRNKQPE